jgi:hypothetical protein
LLDSLTQTVVQDVRQQVAESVARLDVKTIASTVASEQIVHFLNELNFPPASIDPASINISNLELPASQLTQGIIKDFSSTGIDDKATDCRLTVMDDYTVSENNFITQSLTVKGTAIIEGDLVVNGEVPESSPLFQKVVKSATDAVSTGLNDTLFASFSDIIFNKIKTDGMDLAKITVDGQEIIAGKSLGFGITESNLTKVGLLRELRVSGEALFAQTLYTGPKRVGINTLEPSLALSLWDEEIELGFGKRSADQAIIGTPRAQTLVLSSNSKQNLVLNTDGSVGISVLQIGNITITSSDTPPSDDQPKGSIVFNANPTLGGPLGWVSLGGARWANFGIID